MVRFLLGCAFDTMQRGGTHDSRGGIWTEMRECIAIGLKAVHV